MSSDINDKLYLFLREGQKWDKKTTNIEGVFLLKLPTSKQRPSSIAIEVNPTNTTSSGSVITRKKGIIIRDGSELEQFNNCFLIQKLLNWQRK
jgi:hypothetical protein